MFEFDSSKSAANLEKHGIDFEEAQKLWDGPVFAYESAYTDEPRILVVGMIKVDSGQQLSPIEMNTSASSVAVEAARARSPSGKVAISLDGTKVITLEELDALFESGSDEIDQYFDPGKEVVRGGRRKGSGRKSSGRKTFSIRLSPSVHDHARRRAHAAGMSLSDYVESRLK